MIRLDQISKRGVAAESVTLDQPLEHLLACHGRIEERLAVLERVAAHFGERRDEALDALAGCFRFFDSSGVLHTEDEEESLFPRLEGRLSEGEREFVEQLTSEHREAERVYAEIKRMAGDGLPPEAGERFRALIKQMCAAYRAHIEREDSRLNEIGTRLLSEAELAEISVEMKRRRGLAVSG